MSRARPHSAAVGKQAQQRAELIRALSAEIPRFQESTSAVDEAAAAALAIERADLSCLTMLLFGGALPSLQLIRGLRLTASSFRAMRERLEVAGYVRRVPSRDGELVELTEHARAWIETLWGPLAAEGQRVLGQQSTHDLRVMARFMETIRPIQDAHAARIRALLDAPRPRTRSNRLRGALAPAALRRVQIFIEANLHGSIQVSDLAERAELSEFHFARAFKASMGVTPRAFVETRRIERARELLLESDTPIAQIAIQSGFGNQSRFTTTFRRATGFTPALYRRRAAR